MAEQEHQLTPGTGVRPNTAVPANAFSPDFGIPPEAADRARIRAEAARVVAAGKLIPPLSIASLESIVRGMLGHNHFAPDWFAYAMVAVNNALWFPHILTMDPNQCLFLLPHCLRKKKTCAGEYDEYGFVCADCDSCSIAPLQVQAEKLGFTVLVSEATGMAEELISHGRFEAVIGIGCLESLGKTFVRMLDKALPGLAIPLLKGGCEDALLDREMAQEVLAGMGAQAPVCSSNPCFGIRRMQALKNQVDDWFSYESLAGFLTEGHEATERLALEWVADHGKRWRPFLMMAAWEGCSLSRDGADRQTAPVPPADMTLQRLGVAIECFHKASLIHDDIEDEDVERYGHPTLYVKAGMATALNVGDFLIGEGYRLVVEADLPAAKRVQILNVLARSHRRLCLGQGRELDLARVSKPPATDWIEKLFELKTAPAFEAALLIGGILAEADAPILDLFREFSRRIGVGYQIRDDLGDFVPGEELSGKALACSLMVSRLCEKDTGAGFGKLFPFDQPEDRTKVIQALRKEGVFDWAQKRLEQLKQEAWEICEQVPQMPLRQLLFRLAGKLLNPTPV